MDSFTAPRGRLIVLIDLIQEDYFPGFVKLDYDLRKANDPLVRQRNHELLSGTVISSGITHYFPGDRVWCYPWCPGVVHVKSSDIELRCARNIPEGREVRFFSPDYAYDTKGNKRIAPSTGPNGKFVPQGKVTTKVPFIALQDLTDG